jgi:hypothetical protein
MMRADVLGTLNYGSCEHAAAEEQDMKEETVLDR